MRVLGASPFKLFGLGRFGELASLYCRLPNWHHLGRVSMMALSNFGEQQFKFGIEQVGIAQVEIWLLPSRFA